MMFIAIFAGFLGAILGLGGGIIVIPTLTLLFGIDIRYAIAASLVSIIATSSGAAASFLKDHLTNLRLAVVLEVGTVLGAMTGFFITSKIQSNWLFILFGAFLLYSAYSMFKKKQESHSTENHPWSEALNLGSSYPENGTLKSYGVPHLPLGIFIMTLAGVLSALLGIGSGIFKVMALDGVMKLPLKVSSATSNFMIGVTASASAGAFFLRGDVRTEIAAPVAVGIIIGSFFGAKIMPKLPTHIIRKFFISVILVVAIQMIYKGINYGN
ncbi:MAG TPA: sulfite exporter TauE/SafE family protein [Bacteriovoracaceae bacterium]|nr:sulfite exporter TauE/SafE family protein [Bacteriovoracaceae bacterium]